MTIYPEIVDRIHPISLRPGKGTTGIEVTLENKPFLEVVAEALQLKKLRVVPTGGNVTPVSGSSGIAGTIWSQLPLGGLCVRPQYGRQHGSAQTGDRGNRDRRCRARSRSWRRALHDLPDHKGPRPTLVL